MVVGFEGCGLSGWFWVFCLFLFGWIVLLILLSWALNLKLGQMLQSAFKGFDQVQLLLFVGCPAEWGVCWVWDGNGWFCWAQGVEEVIELNCSPVTWNMLYFLSILCAHWRLRGGIGNKERVIATKETFQDYLCKKEGFHYIPRVFDECCVFFALAKG